jgi:hypothetical protein
MGTLVVAEIQMAPTVEFWHRRAKDFPVGRKSAHVYCLFGPPLMVSRGQEMGNPRANQGKEWEIVLSGEQRRYL